MEVQNDWFVSWFDTDYYHTLYQHRDFTEGMQFMQHLTVHLGLDQDDLVLDLACGKGRHAIFLNSIGFNVIGADLSENNVKAANAHANDRLQFVVHDMRNPLRRSYNAIFNLFTSFGFFERQADDLAVLRNLKKALLPDGVVVIDFMNVKKVERELVPKEEIVLRGIRFRIRRYMDRGKVIKQIDVEDQGKNLTFYERVNYYDLKGFRKLSEEAGLKIAELFGDYTLNPYDEDNSDRLILVMK